MHASQFQPGRMAFQISRDFQVFWGISEGRIIFKEVKQSQQTSVYLTVPWIEELVSTIQFLTIFLETTFPPPQKNKTKTDMAYLL